MRALQYQYLRAGYLAYGISIIFLLQILVNAGMNMGNVTDQRFDLAVYQLWRFIVNHVCRDDQPDFEN